MNRRRVSANLFGGADCGVQAEGNGQGRCDQCRAMAVISVMREGIGITRVGGRDGLFFFPAGVFAKAGAGLFGPRT